MKSMLIRVLLGLSGILGGFMALIVLLASFLLSQDDLFYDLSIMGASLAALIGSIVAVIMAARLNSTRIKKTSAACFLLGVLFAAMVFLFTAPLAAICSGLYLASAVSCLFYKEPVKEEEPDLPA